MTKRLISLFLCMVMLFSMLTTAVLAAEDVVLSEENVTVEPETTEPETTEPETTEPETTEPETTEPETTEPETTEPETTEPETTEPETTEPETTEPETTETETTEPETTETETTEPETTNTENTEEIEIEQEPIVEIPVVYPEGFLTPSLVALKEWQAEYAEPSTPFDGSEGYEDTSSVGLGYSVQSVSTYSTGYSADYKTGPYYTKLVNALNNLTGDELVDIIRIAETQVGYHEGDNSSELEGNGDGNDLDNYTEYGWWYGLQGQAWCAMFISWCAAQAGIDTNTINRSALASRTNGLSYGVGTFVSYSFSSVREGDIVCFENGKHVGLVVNKTSTYIEIVEGNTGEDRVERNFYYTNHNSTDPDWRITHYFRPDYERAWRYENGYYYYYDMETNTRVTGWLTLGGDTYYLDPAYNGRMVTGWKQMDGQWYYFNSSGAMQTGWEEIGDYWYYFNSSGHMYDDGWLYLSSGTYYILSNGRMVTGWQEIDGKRYYFRTVENDYGPMGSRATSWLLSNGNYYYLDPNDNDAMVTGWRTIYSSTYSADKVYYFSSSGVMQTGWVQLGGFWYYFRTAGNTYGPQGSRVTGWKTYDDTYCYLDPANNGAMVIGWKTISGNRYYFDENGLMLISWQEIDGNWYYFNSDGEMQTGWCKPGSIWFYMDPTTGVMQTGWLYLEDGTYYLSQDESTLGYMLTSWQEIDGNWYYFNSAGKMQTGWCKPGSIWFYMDPTTGIMQTGWLYLEDGTYYLSRNESTLGYMQTGWVNISGNWHYFNSAGRVQTGWKDYDGDRYYLDPNNNGAALTGTHTIDGVEYTFDENGALIG